MSTPLWFLTSWPVSDSFVTSGLLTALAATSGAFTWAPGPRSSDCTVFVPLRATALPPPKKRKRHNVEMTLA